jgi:hypothetical protein
MHQWGDWDVSPSFFRLVTGERKLLAAILVRAAKDALGGSKSVKDHERREAFNFLSLDVPFPRLFWPDDGKGFTYAYICEQLGICPFTLHKSLRGMIGEELHSTTSNRYLVEQIENWMPDET